MTCFSHHERRLRVILDQFLVFLSIARISPTFLGRLSNS